MKYLHILVSKTLGYSLGGHKSCLKYGCKNYCGISACEALLFIGAKTSVKYAERVKKKGMV